MAPTGKVSYAGRMILLVALAWAVLPGTRAFAENLAPVVSAGASQLATIGTLVTLSGSATDPESGPLTYSCTRSGGSGPDVMLANPATPTPSFTPVRGGEYAFTLTVSDGQGGTSTSAVTVFATGSGPQTLNWIQRTLSTKPSARYVLAAAYDSRRGQVVLFGGFNGTHQNDTWVHDGLSWTRKTPSQSPPIRARHALAYDSSRDRIVLFGGETTAVGFGDTWEWDGGNWTSYSLASTPSGRFGHAMAYDSRRRKVVLFGGNTGGNETWEWASNVRV